MLTKISDLPRYYKAGGEKKRLVVAAAQEPTVLSAAVKASKQNYADVILTGDEKQIKALAKAAGLDLEGITILDECDPARAAAAAVKLVYDGESDLLLKGQLPLAGLLKYVYHKEFGIKKAEIMSHIGLFELPGHTRLVALTDAVVNIAPDLKTKGRIIENGVALLRKIGVEIPRVAALGAVEIINPAMTATTDAGLLSRMSQIGQLVNCVVEGPLTFDRAINPQLACENSVVVGSADLLLAPDIEAASMLYRSLLYFGKAKTASLLYGAKVPVIISSMADSEETILNSLLLASLIKM